MEKEAELLSAFNAGAFERASALSEELWARGVRTETLFRVRSALFLRAGNVQLGLGLAVKLAQQSKSPSAVFALARCMADLFQGFVSPVTGEAVKLQAEPNLLRDLAAILEQGIETCSPPPSPQFAAAFGQALGSIGYHVDEINGVLFGPIAARLYRALGASAAELPSAAERTSASRATGYFLASAGRQAEAERLNAILSEPLTGEAGQLASARGHLQLAAGSTYDSPPIERTSKRLCALSGEHHLGDVLDIGCGTGLTSSQIADRAATITGIDPDAAQVAEAQHRRLFSELACASFDAWSPHSPSIRFDTILSCMVTQDIGDLPAFFSKAANLLKDDGNFYVDFLTLDGTTEEALLFGYIVRHPGYIKRVAGDAGLTVTGEVQGPCQFTGGRYYSFRKAG